MYSSRYLMGERKTTSLCLCKWVLSSQSEACEGELASSPSVRARLKIITIISASGPERTPLAYMSLHKSDLDMSHVCYSTVQCNHASDASRSMTSFIVGTASCAPCRSTHMPAAYKNGQEESTKKISLHHEQARTD